MTTETRKAIIVGTAETWKRAPWADPTAYICSLNDAYALGLPRCDEWWELHPLDQMYFRDPKHKMVRAEDVPRGFYVRPQGHIETLKRMATTIPVWLQQEPPADWPVNAKRLPLEELEAKYGTYWASGPSYMLLSLYDRGFRHFEIYGIHLATAAEYQLQRPNFELLIGRLLGPQVTMTVKDRLRIYTGETGVTVVLPVECPILQHGWKYAFEHKPDAPPDPKKAEWKAVQKEKAALVTALVHSLKGKARADALARLQRLEIIELDIQTESAKRQIGGTLAIGR